MQAIRERRDRLRDPVGRPTDTFSGVDGTADTESNASDAGTNAQEQTAHSKVWNTTSQELTDSVYSNAGTHDRESHRTVEAVSAGGDTATTTSKDWSSDREYGQYSTRVGELFFTSSTTGAGTAATVTNSGTENEFGDDGELWTTTATEINATAFPTGAGHETVETISDTKQVSKSGVHDAGWPSLLLFRPGTRVTVVRGHGSQVEGDENWFKSLRCGRLSTDDGILVILAVIG